MQIFDVNINIAEICPTTEIGWQLFQIQIDAAMKKMKKLAKTASHWKALEAEILMISLSKEEIILQTSFADFISQETAEELIQLYTEQIFKFAKHVTIMEKAYETKQSRDIPETHL